MSEIEEKIINTVKEQYRLWNVNKTELCEFIVDNFDSKFHPDRRSIRQVAMGAEKYLTPDTLIKFCELNRYGLSKGALKTVLCVSKSTVNK